MIGTVKGWKHEFRPASQCQFYRVEMSKNREQKHLTKHMDA